MSMYRIFLCLIIIARFALSYLRVSQVKIYVKEKYIRSTVQVADWLTPFKIFQGRNLCHVVAECLLVFKSCCDQLAGKQSVGQGQGQIYVFVAMSICI